jgi:membrane protease YdiL (CAAX protease family)
MSEPPPASATEDQAPGPPAAGGPGGGCPWDVRESLFVLCLYYGAHFVLTVFVLMAAVAIVREHDPALALDEKAFEQRVLTVSFGPLQAMVCVLAVWIARWSALRRGGEAGLQALWGGRLSPRWLAVAVLAGAGVAAAAEMARRHLPLPADPVSALLRMFLDSGAWGRSWLVVLALGFAPVGEEMIYRGHLYPAFRGRFRAFGAAAAVTLLYGAAHVMASGLNPVALAEVLAMGAVLASLREGSGSLTACILCSAASNGVSVALLL